MVRKNRVRCGIHACNNDTESRRILLILKSDGVFGTHKLPIKALSTQDAYSAYARNWIVPRWGNVQLEQ